MAELATGLGNDSAVHVSYDVRGGRGLLCAREIRAGEEILRVRPLIVNVYDKFKRQCCSGCFRCMTTDGTNDDLVATSSNDHEDYAEARARVRERASVHARTRAGCLRP